MPPRALMRAPFHDRDDHLHGFVGSVLDEDIVRLPQAGDRPQANLVLRHFLECRRIGAENEPGDQLSRNDLDGDSRVVLATVFHPQPDEELRGGSGLGAASLSGQLEFDVEPARLGSIDSSPWARASPGGESQRVGSRSAPPWTLRRRRGFPSRSSRLTCPRRWSVLSRTGFWSLTARPLSSRTRIRG